MGSRREARKAGTQEARAAHVAVSTPDKPDRTPVRGCGQEGSAPAGGVPGHFDPTVARSSGRGESMSPAE